MQRFHNEGEVSITSPKRRSPTFICLVILSVAVVLLLITSIVFIALYALESNNNESSASVTARLKTPVEEKYCGTKTCLLASIGR